MKTFLARVFILLLCNSFSNGQNTTHYKINAKFLPQQKLIDAEATITIGKDHLKSDTIFIKRFSAGVGENGNSLMKINKSGIEGISYNQLQFASDSIFYKIVLPTNFQNEYRIIINYSIDLNQYSNWQLEYFGYYYFPSNAKDQSLSGDLWYPDIIETHENPVFLRDFDIEFESPIDYLVVTSGSQEMTKSSKKTKTQTFRAHRVRGCALNILYGFEPALIKDGDYSVETFYKPEMKDEYLKAAKLSLDAITWYRDKFGFFPTKEIKILSGSSKWGGGFPSSNLFWIHHRNLKEEFLRWITSHELGHYYWGYYVYSNPKENLGWLMLANGIWTDQLYIAEKNNRSLLEQFQSLGSGDWLVDYFEGQLLNRNQSLGISSQEIEELDYDYNSLTAHGKAATGLFMISQLIGTEAFLNIQKQIISDFEFQELTLNDFIDLLEGKGLTNADELLRDWMKGDASLAYYVSDVEKSKDFDYDITIRRSGTVSYPIEIMVVGTNGEIQSFTFKSSERWQTFKVKLKSDLEEVLLDPKGIAPFANSSNSKMQKLYLHALYRSGFRNIFKIVAKEYLQINKDEDISKLLTEVDP